MSEFLLLLLLQKEVFLFMDFFYIFFLFFIYSITTTILCSLASCEFIISFSTAFRSVCVQPLLGSDCSFLFVFKNYKFAIYVFC